MNCRECKEDRVQNEPVPYIVHESMMARLERASKRWMIFSIIMFVLLIGTNLLWMYYENQFEDQYVEQDIDTGEGDAIVAGIGDVHYGEDTPSSQNENP